MSFSKPKAESPCKMWIGYKGGAGKFRYWDREREEEVEVPLPLKFIVLDDDRSKVTGYNKHSESGVWSNEVRNTKTEELHVRTFKGVDEVRGLYSDIKGKVLELGGKYTKSLYAALVTEEGLELVNFELRGAALAAWFKWRKKFRGADFRTLIVTVTGTAEDTTGNISYRVPVFGHAPMNPDYVKEAERMDRELQRYFADKAEAEEPIAEAELADVEAIPTGRAALEIDDGMPL